MDLSVTQTSDVCKLLEAAADGWQQAHSASIDLEPSIGEVKVGSPRRKQRRRTAEAAAALVEKACANAKSRPAFDSTSESVPDLSSEGSAAARARAFLESGCGGLSLLEASQLLAELRSPVGRRTRRGTHRLPATAGAGLQQLGDDGVAALLCLVDEQLASFRGSLSDSEEDADDTVVEAEGTLTEGDAPPSNSPVPQLGGKVVDSPSARPRDVLSNITNSAASGEDPWRRSMVAGSLDQSCGPGLPHHTLQLSAAAPLLQSTMRCHAADSENTPSMPSFSLRLETSRDWEGAAGGWAAGEMACDPPGALRAPELRSPDSASSVLGGLSQLSLRPRGTDKTPAPSMVAELSLCSAVAESSARTSPAASAPASDCDHMPKQVSSADHTSAVTNKSDGTTGSDTSEAEDTFVTVNDTDMTLSESNAQGGLTLHNAELPPSTAARERASAQLGAVSIDMYTSAATLNGDDMNATGVNCSESQSGSDGSRISDSKLSEASDYFRQPADVSGEVLVSNFTAGAKSKVERKQPTRRQKPIVSASTVKESACYKDTMRGAETSSVSISDTKDVYLGSKGDQINASGTGTLSRSLRSHKPSASCSTDTSHAKETVDIHKSSFPEKTLSSAKTSHASVCGTEDLPLASDVSTINTSKTLGAAMSSSGVKKPRASRTVRVDTSGASKGSRANTSGLSRSCRADTSSSSRSRQAVSSNLGEVHLVDTTSIAGDGSVVDRRRSRKQRRRTAEAAAALVEKACANAKSRPAFDSTSESVPDLSSEGSAAARARAFLESGCGGLSLLEASQLLAELRSPVGRRTRRGTHRLPATAGAGLQQLGDDGVAALLCLVDEQLASFRGSLSDSEEDADDTVVEAEGTLTEGDAPPSNSPVPQLGGKVVDSPSARPRDVLSNITNSAASGEDPWRRSMVAGSLDQSCGPGLPHHTLQLSAAAPLLQSTMRCHAADSENTPSMPSFSLRLETSRDWEGAAGGWAAGEMACDPPGALRAPELRSPDSASSVLGGLSQLSLRPRGTDKTPAPSMVAELSLCSAVAESSARTSPAASAPASDCDHMPKQVSSADHTSAVTNKSDGTTGSDTSGAEDTFVTVNDTDMTLSESNAQGGLTLHNAELPPSPAARERASAQLGAVSIDMYTSAATLNGDDMNATGVNCSESQSGRDGSRISDSKLSEASDYLRQPVDVSGEVLVSNCTAGAESKVERKQPTRRQKPIVSASTVKESACYKDTMRGAETSSVSISDTKDVYIGSKGDQINASGTGTLSRSLRSHKPSASCSTDTSHGKETVDIHKSSLPEKTLSSAKTSHASVCGTEDLPLASDVSTINTSKTLGAAMSSSGVKKPRASRTVRVDTSGASKGSRANTSGLSRSCRADTSSSSRSRQAVSSNPGEVHLVDTTSIAGDGSVVDRRRSRKQRRRTAEAAAALVEKACANAKSRPAFDSTSESVPDLSSEGSAAARARAFLESGCGGLSLLEASQLLAELRSPVGRRTRRGTHRLPATAGAGLQQLGDDGVAALLCLVDEQLASFRGSLSDSEEDADDTVVEAEGTLTEGDTSMPQSLPDARHQTSMEEMPPPDLSMVFPGHQMEVEAAPTSFRADSASTARSGSAEPAATWRRSIVAGSLDRTGRVTSPRASLGMSSAAPLLQSTPRHGDVGSEKRTRRRRAAADLETAPCAGGVDGTYHGSSVFSKTVKEDVAGLPTLAGTGCPTYHAALKASCNSAQLSSTCNSTAGRSRTRGRLRCQKASAGAASSSSAGVSSAAGGSLQRAGSCTGWTRSAADWDDIASTCCNDGIVAGAGHAAEDRRAGGSAGLVGSITFVGSELTDLTLSLLDFTSRGAETDATLASHEPFRPIKSSTVLMSETSVAHSSSLAPESYVDSELNTSSHLLAALSSRRGEAGVTSREGVQPAKRPSNQCVSSRGGVMPEATVEEWEVPPMRALQTSEVAAAAASSALPRDVSSVVARAAAVSDGPEKSPSLAVPTVNNAQVDVHMTTDRVSMLAETAPSAAVTVDAEAAAGVAVGDSVAVDSTVNSPGDDEDSDDGATDGEASADGAGGRVSASAEAADAASTVPQSPRRGRDSCGAAPAETSASSQSSRPRGRDSCGAAPAETSASSQSSRPRRGRDSCGAAPAETSASSQSSRRSRTRIVVSSAKKRTPAQSSLSLASDTGRSVRTSTSGRGTPRLKSSRSDVSSLLSASGCPDAPHSLHRSALSKGSDRSVLFSSALDQTPSPAAATLRLSSKPRARTPQPSAEELLETTGDRPARQGATARLGHRRRQVPPPECASRVGLPYGPAVTLGRSPADGNSVAAGDLNVTAVGPLAEAALDGDLDYSDAFSEAEEAAEEWQAAARGPTLQQRFAALCPQGGAPAEQRRPPPVARHQPSASRGGVKLFPDTDASHKRWLQASAVGLRVTAEARHEFVRGLARFERLALDQLLEVTGGRERITTEDVIQLLRRAGVADSVAKLEDLIRHHVPCEARWDLLEMASTAEW